MKQPAGTISTDGNTASITFERRLPHPVGTVWTAITDPAQRERWFGPTSLEPKEGGRIETIAEGPPAPAEVRKSKGIIRVWDPPHTFEYEDDSPNTGKTIIRFELTTDGDTTILRLINSGLKIPDARGYAPGWHAFLDRLEALLDGGQLPGWGEIYSTMQPEYSM